uniref:Secreted protein n=1 Tax=Anopheles quadriannulatus TaxID=34691 RepID=A0A182XSA8_ANOQN
RHQHNVFFHQCIVFPSFLLRALLACAVCCRLLCCVCSRFEKLPHSLTVCKCVICASCRCAVRCTYVCE